MATARMFFMGMTTARCFLMLLRVPSTPANMPLVMRTFSPGLQANPRFSSIMTCRDELHKAESKLQDLKSHLGLSEKQGEVLHLLIGDMGYGADGVVVLVAPYVHDVAQVVVFGFVGLELAQVPECGAKEDVVDECGGVGVFVGVDEVLWYVGLDNGFFVAEEAVELALAFDAGVEYMARNDNVRWRRD